MLCIVGGLTTASSASTGGLILAVKGCGYARLTFSRPMSNEPAVSVTKAGSYATWVLYRDTASLSHTYTASVYAPSVSAHPALLPGDPSATTLPAGRYTIVVCGDGPTSLRITVPSLGRWTTPKLTTIGPREATIAPLGTAAAETGIARGPLSGSRKAFAVLVLSRMGSMGGTVARLCFAPRGELCSTQTSGQVNTFDAVAPDRLLYVAYGMHAATGPVDGVAEMYSTRAYTETDRDRLLVASLPMP
jgi:hypothetical protein